MTHDEMPKDTVEEAVKNALEQFTIHISNRLYRSSLSMSDYQNIVYLMEEIKNTLTTTPDETEKCWLEFVDGYLTCTHNHTPGALCLGLKCPYCHELKCKCYE